MPNPLIKIYETLLAHYGDLHWWPARTPYEVIIGAILTQNTAWANVERAIANFGDNLSPEYITKVDIDILAEIIKPSGYYHQKAWYLKSVTAWYARYKYEVQTVQNEPLSSLRNELLGVKGIGPETADSILLYAFGFPTFVVDAYTLRLCERYPLPVERKYTKVKDYFESNLPRSVEIYNQFHALIVINGKNHCGKRVACEGCPLFKV